MAPRTYTCQDCGDSYQAGPRGPLPLRCPACKAAQARIYIAKLRGTYQHPQLELICAMCGTTFKARTKAQRYCDATCRGQAAAESRYVKAFIVNACYQCHQYCDPGTNFCNDDCLLAWYTANPRTCLLANCRNTIPPLMRTNQAKHKQTTSSLYILKKPRRFCCVAHLHQFKLKQHGRPAHIPLPPALAAHAARQQQVRERDADPMYQAGYKLLHDVEQSMITHLSRLVWQNVIRAVLDGNAPTKPIRIIQEFHKGDNFTPDNWLIPDLEVWHIGSTELPEQYTAEEIETYRTLFTTHIETLATTPTKPARKPATVRITSTLTRKP